MGALRIHMVGPKNIIFAYVFRYSRAPGRGGPVGRVARVPPERSFGVRVLKLFGTAVRHPLAPSGASTEVPRRISLGFAHSAAAVGDWRKERSYAACSWWKTVCISWRTPVGVRGPGRVAKFFLHLHWTSHAAAGNRRRVIVRTCPRSLAVKACVRKVQRRLAGWRAGTRVAEYIYLRWKTHICRFSSRKYVRIGKLVAEPFGPESWEAKKPTETDRNHRFLCFSGRKNYLGTKILQYLHLRYIRCVVFTKNPVKMRYYTIYLHLRYCK